MDILTRICTLQKQFATWKIDGLIIENPIDLFYLTGLHVSTGVLLVGKNESYFLVDNRYIEACKETSPVPIALREKKSVEEKLAQLSQRGEIWGFDELELSYHGYKKWLKRCQQEDLELKPLEAPTAKVRVIKQEDELGCLRQAAVLGSEGYDFLLANLCVGVTEKQLADRLELFWKERGGSLGFDTIIAFGSNASMPHYSPGNMPLEPNQQVLIDLGVKLNEYHSDMTRTVFFGNPDPLILNAYKATLRAQEAVLEHCSSGASSKELDRLAKKIICENGFENDVYQHGLGHGLGLEVHEFPSIGMSALKDCVLEENMVVTIEPGIYIPGKGGIRIEDTIAIQREGYEDLSCRSKEVTCIEVREKVI